MTRRTITIPALLVALAAAGIAATAAPAKQGADDPAPHVRHTGKDDGAKARTAAHRRRAHHRRPHEARDDHGRGGHGRDD